MATEFKHDHDRVHCQSEKFPFFVSVFLWWKSMNKRITKNLIPISIIHLGQLHPGSGRCKDICVERKESQQGRETGCHGPSFGECISSLRNDLLHLIGCDLAESG